MIETYSTLTDPQKRQFRFAVQQAFGVKLRQFYNLVSGVTEMTPVQSEFVNRVLADISKPFGHLNATVITVDKSGSIQSIIDKSIEQLNNSIK